MKALSVSKYISSMSRLSFCVVLIHARGSVDCIVQKTLKRKYAMRSGNRDWEGGIPYVYCSKNIDFGTAPFMFECFMWILTLPLSCPADSLVQTWVGEQCFDGIITISHTAKEPSTELPSYQTVFSSDLQDLPQTTLQIFEVPVEHFTHRGFPLTRLYFNGCLLFYSNYPLHVSVVRPSSGENIYMGN
jgi:hypothetical protein